MKNIELKYLTQKSIYYLHYRHIFRENSSKKYIQVYCFDFSGELMFIANYVVTPEETYCFDYHDINMCIISNAIDWNYIITTELDKKFGYE